MFTITLSKEEQETLVDLLECSVSDIHQEIRRTENHCLKEILKTRKHVLANMLDNLRQIRPSMAT